jgi:hypothetical protein
MDPDLTPHSLMAEFADERIGARMWVREHDDDEGPKAAACVFMEAEAGTGAELLHLIVDRSGLTAAIHHPEWGEHVDLMEMLDAIDEPVGGILHYRAFSHQGQTMYVVLAAGAEAVEEMDTLLSMLVEDDA